MLNTTVYLPPEMKRLLQWCSEAKLLREAVAWLADETEAPVPKLPLFRSTGPSIAPDIDRALGGLGLR